MENGINKPYEYADKYTFYAEWYNEVADLVKPFVLSFYPHDETLELFDLKCHRLFLRRTKVAGITLKSLYKGAIVNIYCRQVHIVGYGNVWTERVYEEALQSIFFIVKPDSLRNIGEVLEFLEKNDFKITKLKLGIMPYENSRKIYSCSADEALQHEREHTMDELSNKPCVGVEAVGERGLYRWMNALGVGERDEGCCGRDDSVATDCITKSVHFSLCPQVRARETDAWFPKDGSKNALIKSTCRLSDSACCIIKPHAVQEGLVGGIIKNITESGFAIEAMEMINLSRAAAEKFYEVYKNVVPEYSGMVSHLASSACVVMEVSHITEPSSSPIILRELIGANDPEVAKKVQPNSIRAKFGQTTVLNAVHCTDLPDDAQLEVEFFFKIHPR